MIAILCASSRSNYFHLQQEYQLDIYTSSRCATTFSSSFPVIAHPPCAQWSRLHKFSKPNPFIKSLAVTCYEKVMQNGGIFEHPAGSHVFKYVGADWNKIISVDQHWWNFPGRKRTYLLFHNVKPIAFPLNFNAIPGNISNTLHSSARHITTLSFNRWLLDCIISSENGGYQSINPSEIVQQKQCNEVKF